MECEECGWANGIHAASCKNSDLSVKALRLAADALSQALGHMIAVAVLSEGIDAFRDKFLSRTEHLSKGAILSIETGANAIADAVQKGIIPKRP